jgi:hypothetical protein
MKKLFYLFITGVLSSFNCQSQKINSENLKFLIGIRAARSFATSGDIYGGFGTVFLEKETNKKGTVALIIGGNMHASGNRLIYPNPRNPSEMIDASWRYLSSGVQAGILGGRKMFISKNHLFHFSIGPLLRYQNNSNDGYSLYFPLATGLPIPVYSVENFYSRKSFSFVGLGQIEYRFLINSNLMVGIHSSAQFDTEGDFFYNYGITVGTTFFKK